MKRKNVPKVSILMPIYNVEQYLHECLDSVINQTLRDIEIICINDGSTDSSPEIIKQYANQDSRIVIINKKNSGYGDSMNQGIKKATGKYIGIVESDDWVEPNMFESLYDLAEMHQVQVVKSNFYFYKAKENSNEKFNLFRPDEVGRIINPADNYHITCQQPAIWSALYLREFLVKNSIRFLPTPGASYQDVGFNWKVWASANRVYFTNHAYLHYRFDNENSSVNNSGKIFCIQDEWKEIVRFAKEKNLYDQRAKLMQFIKFGNYYWNLERLNRSSAKKFLRVFNSEYKQAEKDGLLDYSIFPKPQARALKIIVDRPWSFFTSRSTYKVGKKFKGVALKVANLNPSYRRRAHIVKQNNDIIDQNSQMKEKLDQLEIQVDKLLKDRE